MASYFNLILDTLGPASPSIIIEAGASYIGTQLVNTAISTSDGDTTGYQIKIWGNVDTSYDANIQTTEGASAWTAYTTAKQVKLSAVDGLKTLYLKIRDNVWNESSQASDTITLDMTLPVATISVGPDVTKVSKVTGKRTCSFSFQSDSIFVAYKVKVVPQTDSINTAGTQIATTNGSTNMSGSGSFPASTNINCTIDGADLEIASSGDGNKIVKVFVQESSGNWNAA
jgi:hypothetical protein